MRRVLTVRLEKGEVRTVRLSSFLKHGDLRVLGVWRWAEGSPDDDALARTAVEGVPLDADAVPRHSCSCTPSSVPCAHRRWSKPSWTGRVLPDGLRAPAARPGPRTPSLSCATDLQLANKRPNRRRCDVEGAGRRARRGRACLRSCRQSPRRDGSCSRRVTAERRTRFLSSSRSSTDDRSPFGTSSATRSTVTCSTG